MIHKKYLRYSGCIAIFVFALSIFMLLIGYLYLSGDLSILILGLDSREYDGTLGRTDTMILTRFDPWRPSVGVLSIPRDLWVNIPGHGENRINTAHFFAEIEKQGSGPDATMAVVENNFGVDVNNYIRIRFDQLIKIIDVIGGLDIYLPEPMSGYPAGEHHINGEQVLVFVRDRSGSDDFFRMGRGQLVLKALVTQLLAIDQWKNYPQILAAYSASIETNLPIYYLPKIALALLRTGTDDINFRIISREMVTPFITDGGAAVLAPNWILIEPLLNEFFRE